MSVPFKFGKDVFLSDKQIDTIVKKANLKLTKNYKILKELMKAFQKEL
jgi:tRNA(Phe) wybutosine-synthesizing methylase Tyw3